MVGEDEKSHVVAASDITKDASNPSSNAVVDVSNNNSKSEADQHAPVDTPNDVSDVAVEGAHNTADKVVDLDALARRSSLSSSSSSPSNLQEQTEEKPKVGEEEKVTEEDEEKHDPKPRRANRHLHTYTNLPRVAL